MKKTIIATALALLSYLPLSANVTGKVTNLINEPIPNVEVCQGQKCVTTDVNGNFDISKVSVEKNTVSAGLEAKLYQNFQNPFSFSTNIRYNLPKSANVNVEVYDLQGRLVKNIYSGFDNSGEHTIFWDGRDNNKRIAKGVYLYSLNIAGKKQFKKMILLGNGTGSINNNNNYNNINNNQETTQDTRLKKEAYSQLDSSLSFKGVTFPDSTIKLNNLDTFINIKFNEYPAIINNTQKEIKLFYLRTASDTSNVNLDKTNKWIKNDGEILQILNNTSFIGYGYLKQSDSIQINKPSLNLDIEIISSASSDNNYLNVEFMDGEYFSIKNKFVDKKFVIDYLTKNARSISEGMWYSWYISDGKADIIDLFNKLSFDAKVPVFNKINESKYSVNPSLRIRTFYESTFDYYMPSKSLESTLNSFLASDKTDEIIASSPDYVCHDYSRDVANNARLQGIPMFNVSLVSKDKKSHAVNSILVGDNPLLLSNWMIFEPQTDLKLKEQPITYFENGSIIDIETRGLSPTTHLPYNDVLYSGIIGNDTLRQQQPDYLKKLGITLPTTFPYNFDSKIIVDKVKPYMNIIVK